MILFFSSAESDIHSQLSVVKMRIKEKNSSDFLIYIFLKLKKYSLVMQKQLLKVHASKAAIFSCRAITINLVENYL